MVLPCAYVHFSRKTMNTKRKSILQFFTVFRLEIKWLKKRCKSIYLLATHTQTHLHKHTTCTKGSPRMCSCCEVVFFFPYQYSYSIFYCEFQLQLLARSPAFTRRSVCPAFHTDTHMHTHCACRWQESRHFA